MPMPPNDRTPETELDMLEQAMGSMMQGIFSSMFRSIFEPSSMIENGRIIQQEGAAAEDEFGGNDFRRLAQKSRQSRGLPDVENTSSGNKGGHGVCSSQQPQPMTSLLDMILGDEQPQSTRTGAGTILDLLLPDRDRFFHRTIGTTSSPFPNGEEDPQGGTSSHFSFTSSSQRRVLRPDGTEESYITRTQNGVTETIKRIKHPDGTVEETRESGGGGRNHNPLLITHPDNRGSDQSPPFPLSFEQQQEQQGKGGLLFRAWKKIFG